MKRYERSRALLRAAAVVAVAGLAACAPTAEVDAPEPMQVDRTVRPEPGPAVAIDFPDIQRRTLSNGLDVWVVERTELPLVTTYLVVNAGSAAESADQAGLATLTAAMLDEGTETRTALELAEAIDFLGADFGTGATYDASYLYLGVLERNLPAALDLFADVALNPTFPEPELVRVRQERMTSIIEAMDRPSMVASEQFALRIYGPEHPYGRPPEGTLESLPELDRAELRDFYRTYYRPNNSDLIVVGDVDADAVVELLEEKLGAWEAAEVPAIDYPEPPPAQDETTIYLIDKPGAAQSEIRIGHVGVARDNPDYFPLLVMNTILGGQFSSRINMNLREDKGYTYGARSSYSMRREPGPFIAQAGVQTATTQPSIVEFMNELEGIRSDRPVTQDELEFAKARLIRSEPLQLETNSRVAGQLMDVILYDLPLDYFDTYVQNVQSVTLSDVERVAEEYIQPENFAIVVVGDRSQIEEGLRELPYPVEIVEVEP